MFAWLQKRYRWRRLAQAARALVREKKGYLRQSWTWDSADRAPVVDQVQAWLAEQIPTMRTPYGYSDLSIMLWLKQLKDGRVSIVWQPETGKITRSDAPEAIAEATATLFTAPAFDPPLRLETYLVNVADALIQSYEKLGYYQIFLCSIMWLSGISRGRAAI